MNTSNAMDNDNKKKKFINKLFSIDNSEFNSISVRFLGIKFSFPKRIKNLHLYENLPIENNKIVLRSCMNAYNCNPKYIAEEIIRQNLPYDLVWITNDYFETFKNSFNPKLKLVQDSTEEALREYATARIWIDNERLSRFIERGLGKRKGQIYINTWHGSLGIKKTANARNDLLNSVIRVAKKDSKQTDYTISNGKFTTNLFKQIFFGHSEIKEFGHPRNDIFFKDNTEVKKKVYEILGISENKKILLYAPTFREDFDLSCYTMDYNKVLSAISNKFGGEWVIVTRLHPKLVANRELFLSKANGDIIDATNYPDIQELLVSTEAIITDYSSCIYDFMLTRKPGFIFATDIEKYDNDRGLYYPLSSTPFPVAENNEQMIKNIENFDNEKYLPAVEEFLKDKGCIDDGHASERVVDLIKKELINV